MAFRKIFQQLNIRAAELEGERGQLRHALDEAQAQLAQRSRELAEVRQRTIDEARKLAAAHPDIIVTSSDTGLGIPELRAAVVEAIG